MVAAWVGHIAPRDPKLSRAKPIEEASRKHLRCFEELKTRDQGLLIGIRNDGQRAFAVEDHVAAAASRSTTVDEVHLGRIGVGVVGHLNALRSHVAHRLPERCPRLLAAEQPRIARRRGGFYFRWAGSDLPCARS